MALIHIRFASEVLGRNTDIHVSIPQKRNGYEIGVENKAQDGLYKTVLLLHGLSDDNSCWLRRTAIDRYATERGIAVVMPSADRSFYTDMKYGDQFFTYISQEVLKVAREYLPLSEKREDTFIAGQSMGGYGALKIALKCPERFSAVAALSSVADIRLFMKEYAPDLRPAVFGESEPIPDEEDLFCLAKSVDALLQKPRVFMCCGLDDFLYQDNIRLRDLFKTLSYDYTYQESEGTHNWDFWQSYLPTILDWMLGK